MSLRSTRKRLKEYMDLLRYQTSPKEEHDSFLSKFGVNPESIMNYDKKSKVNIINTNIEKNDFTENYIEKTKLEKAKNDAYSIKIDPYEKDIKKKITFSKEKENINLNELNILKSKPKKSFKMVLLMAIVEIFTLVVVFGVGMFIRFSNSTQQVPFDPEKVVNTEIDSETLKKMQGYRSIAIFGLDSRTGSVSNGNNADVNIIANINYDNGEVKLVSVYRDLYLNVSDNNRYGKFNSAYFYGGPEGALKSLNKNLDLNITNYVSFNWKAVADGINMLGGIDLEVKRSEYNFMNSFIHETCKATGIDSNNPAANYIKGPGMQHLNGVQSVAYARLRLMDSDFQRVERQKRVIALCLEKAKSLDFNTIMGIAISIIPTISYNFDWAELTSLVKSIDDIHIVESTGFPSNKYFTTMKMGSSGDCVIPNPLSKAVIELHQLLYDDNEYTPSKSLNAYSNRILELKEEYAKENMIEASRIASENEEDKNGEITPKGSAILNTIEKKASFSNTNKIINTFKDAKDEIIEPIVNREYDEYEDEPEEDDNIFEVPFAPRTNTQEVSPVSPIDIRDVNAPYDSSMQDTNAPYNSSIQGTNAPYNSSIQGTNAPYNNIDVNKNNSPVSPISDESNFSREVAAPPGVKKSEQEPIINMPNSPIAPTSGDIMAPHINDRPEQVINSGPPIG